jgi:hypothetical protein
MSQPSAAATLFSDNGGVEWCWSTMPKLVVWVGRRLVVDYETCYGLHQALWIQNGG